MRLWIHTLVLMLTFISLSVSAADKKSKDKEEADKKDNFVRHPVLHTKYTRNCPTYLGLKTPPKETRRGRTLSERNYQRILRVHDAIGEEDLDEALKLLRPLFERTKRQSYDHAVVNNLLGQVYSMKEKYQQAIKHTKLAYEADEFQGQRKDSVIRSLGALYLVVEDYKSALPLFQKWIRNTVDPASDDYVRLAIAYMQNKKLKEAICPARLAINTSEKIPKQQLFDVLLQLHYELKDFNGGVAILKENLKYHPDDKKVWVRLAQFYAKLKMQKEARATWELAYKKDLLEKESELKQLAGLYSLEEVPYKAAELMQTEIEKGRIESTEKHWRSVAYSWFQAKEKEKALFAYGKAAELADDGELYISQGQIYADLSQYKEAIKAFNSALKKGGLKDRSEAIAYYRSGISFFYLGEIEKAREYLNRSKGYDSYSSFSASWLNYITDWERNQKLLAES